MTATVARDWIDAEFSRGIDAERGMAEEARARGESPPDPALGVLYHEIAAADERHQAIVETIATRYGHTPSRTTGGGIGETIARLKNKVAHSVSGADALHDLAGDLAAKANAIHWYVAWSAAFAALGDAESARELSAVLTEEQAHRDALQQWLNRLVERGARGETDVAKA
ncbi:MAG TPA: DUF892 family protein [Isosphaeraceae bacterium]|jgi:ferritin-like metal-binding protein YciE|nr:DUF892 family protein [Isosphaeraceae bacterium]